MAASGAVRGSHLGQPILHDIDGFAGGVHRRAELDDEQLELGEVVAVSSRHLSPIRRSIGAAVAKILLGSAQAATARARDRFHPKSRATLTSRMTTSATAVPGSSTSVVKTNDTRTMTVEATARTRIPARAPVSCRTRKCPTDTRPKTSSAITLPMDAIADRSNPTASTMASAAVTTRPVPDPTAEPPPHHRRELADRGHLLAQPGRRIEPGVGGPGGGEQRGDAHHPVAGAAERWFGGHGEGGSAGIDDLVDRQRAEHPQGHRDVDHGCDPQGQEQGARQLAGRVGEILGRERDDAESQEGEERQRHAGHDVAERRVAREGQQVGVHVGERRHREHGEDADHDDHDDRLGLGDGLRSGDVERWSSPPPPAPRRP